MRELVQAIPDPDVILALEPEELGAKLLFLVRRRDENGMFNPGNYEGELRSLPQHIQGYPQARLPEIELALSEAWAWLEAQGLIVPASGSNGTNGWRVLSRRARAFESEAEFAGYAAARMLPKAALHPSIADKVWLAFVRGDFDVAVFLGMKQVEIAVRQASGAEAGMLGVKLARWAFHPENGPLTDKEAEPGERQARCDLFAGALGSYKNPQSHRHVALDDPIEAMEQIMLASHLLRVIDGRVKANGAS